MKPIDFERLYNNLAVTYIDLNEYRIKLGSHTNVKIRYIHAPKVYSGERLGYMVIFVCDKIAYILSYMDGKPYIIENGDDIYGFVKNELKIKFNHFTFGEQDNVAVFDVSGSYIDSRMIDKLHDSYNRGYFDERIASYEALQNMVEDEVECDASASNVYIHCIYISIIVIIVLTSLYISW